MNEFERAPDETDGHSHTRELRRELLSRLAHDLKSPLQSVVGYAELLTMGQFGELTAEQERVVSRIDRQARELEFRVGEILGVISLELEDPPDGSGSRVGPRALIETAVERLRQGGPGRDFRFRNDVRADFPDVYGDRAQLERLFLYVIRALLDVGQPDGPLRVEADRDRTGEPPFARFRLAVSGEASGQDPEESGRPGPGLLLARLIAEAHGGELRTRTDRAGSTALVVTLPILGVARRDRE